MDLLENQKLLTSMALNPPTLQVGRLRPTEGLLRDTGKKVVSWGRRKHWPEGQRGVVTWLDDDEGSAVTDGVALDNLLKLPALPAPYL